MSSIPVVVLAVVLLVAYLAGGYLIARERNKIRRLMGPKTFRPDWSRTRVGDYRRRRGSRRGTQGFSPQWSRRTPADGPDREGSSPAPHREDAPGDRRSGGPTGRFPR